MVCAYVREDNPRALASGLSPVRVHNHTITALLHQHKCALCALYDIYCKTFEYHSNVQHTERIKTCVSNGIKLLHIYLSAFLQLKQILLFTSNPKSFTT